MQASDKSSRVGETVGRYRITRELGRGGMGVVYEAVHETIGYRAALKVLGILANDPKHNTYVSRFLDEARAVNRINHPGVVRVFDFGELPDGNVYIMMEFLEGQTVAERLRDIQLQARRPLTVSGVLNLLAQLASAMAQAHDKNILHRDLKPENAVLVRDDDVDGDERIKLLDFGLARFLDSNERRTTAGVALGTPMYMSPEQCMGETLDGKSDVYSAGVIFYELITGRPPFQADEISKLMLKHINDPVPPIKELAPLLPDSVADLIHSMLKKAPGERPTMQQIGSRIDELLKKGGLPEAEMLPASAPKGGGATGPEAATRMTPALKQPKTEMVARAGGRPWNRRSMLSTAGLIAAGLLTGGGMALIGLAARHKDPVACPPQPSCPQPSCPREACTPVPCTAPPPDAGKPGKKKARVR